MDALSAYTKSGGKGVEAEATVKAKGGNTLTEFRKILAKGGVKFIAAGGFNRDNATPKVESGDADLIIFGRWFIANPDLPKRDILITRSTSRVSLHECGLSFDAFVALGMVRAYHRIQSGT
jgi:2,4-dienoyl-CoA reductase-like NADH-dependent reductase (Old Yellow Enzyme family)